MTLSSRIPPTHHTHCLVSVLIIYSVLTSFFFFGQKHLRNRVCTEKSQSPFAKHLSASYMCPSRRTVNWHLFSMNVHGCIKIKAGQH